MYGDRIPKNYRPPNRLPESTEPNTAADASPHHYGPHNPPQNDCQQGPPNPEHPTTEAHKPHPSAQTARDNAAHG